MKPNIYKIMQTFWICEKGGIHIYNSLCYDPRKKVFEILCYDTNLFVLQEETPFLFKLIISSICTNN